MKRKLFLTIIFSLTFYFANAQNYRFGVTLNLGVSKSLHETSTSLPSKFTKSGNLGFYLEQDSKSPFGLSTFGLELIWVQLEGLLSSDRIIPNTIIERSQIEERIHITYIGFPLYYRLHNGKQGVSIGIQSLFFLDAQSNRQRFRSANNNQFVSNHFEVKGINFKTFDFGPKIGIDINLFNNIRFRTDFYYGLLKKEPTGYSSSSDFNSMQVTFGLISFFNSKKSE